MSAPPAPAQALAPRSGIPGRDYPPPELLPRDLAWRYGLAGGWAGICVVVALISFIVGQSFDPASAGSIARQCLRIVVAGASAWLIRYRRSRPLTVAIVIATLAYFSLSGFGFMTWALISLSTRRQWKAILAYSGVLIGELLLFSIPQLPFYWLDHDNRHPALIPWLMEVGLAFVLMVLWMAAIIAMGFYVGARRDLIASYLERATTAEREQNLRIAQAQAGERARIAREMHDVLAHRISLVAMHAGVLAYREDLSAEQTRDIAATIQENAHHSLTELRAVLSDLRDGAQPSTPQPTLADLDDLLADARNLGSAVSLARHLDSPEKLPTATSRHAYRIIQECLTNARKHADGAPVQVAITGKPGAGLTLEVRNWLSHAGGVPGAGLGLVGMQERAATVGGTLDAGVTQGEFIVKAWLPWQK